MNDNEAKFLLRAFRPDGSDARDPIFADALAQAEKNPSVRAWLDRAVAFDQTVAAKLHEVQPPVDLRDAILAGGRASQRRGARWGKPVWLALAASVAIVLTFSVSRGMRHTGSSAHDFAAFAVNELVTARDHHGGGGPAYARLQARLVNAVLPLPGSIKVDTGELQRAGCHTARFAGHDVFEICFERDGRGFHLYMANVKDFATETTVGNSLVMTNRRFAAAAWKDARFAYVLVTDEGVEALRRLI